MPGKSVYVVSFIPSLGIVAVRGAASSQVKKAMGLLEKGRAHNRKDPEAQRAIKFYRMAKKFVRTGRFKKRYTRKKRA